MKQEDIDAAENAIMKVLGEIENHGNHMGMDAVLDRLRAELQPATNPAGSFAQHLLAMNITITAIAIRDAFQGGADAVVMPSVERAEPESAATPA